MLGLFKLFRMSVFLIVLVTAIWGYFKYDDIQFLAGGGFKIDVAIQCAA